MRALTARSEIDRELHRHLGRAAYFVQSAMSVCGRAARGKSRTAAAVYREQQRRLNLAADLLAGIGLVDDSAPDEVRGEARALCAWLEGRERVAGARRKPRRGSEYQTRLNRVLVFLEAVRNPVADDSDPKATKKRTAPVSEPEQSIYTPTGVADG